MTTPSGVMAGLCLLLYGSCAAGAAEAAAEVSPWRLGLAIGYGERTNPLSQSEHGPAVVDRDIAWLGERFSFDSGDFGVPYAGGERATVSAGARINRDRLFFSRTDPKFFRVLGTTG